MKNKKIIWIVLIAFIIILLILLNINTDNKILGNWFNIITGKAYTNETKLTYIAYDNQNVNSVKSLVIIENDNGIDYIIKPDRTKVNANGKTKISLDIISALDENVIFKVKTANSEEKEEKIVVTQENINSQFEIQMEENGSEYLNKIEYSFKQTGDILSYSIGDNVWINYDNTNMIIDYSKIRQQLTGIHKGIADIDIKKKDKSGNILYAHKKEEVYSNKIYYFYQLKSLGWNNAGATFESGGEGWRIKP